MSPLSVVQGNIPCELCMGSDGCPQLEVQLPESLEKKDVDIGMEEHGNTLNLVFDNQATGKVIANLRLQGYKLDMLQASYKKKTRTYTFKLQPAVESGLLREDDVDEAEDDAFHDALSSSHSSDTMGDAQILEHAVPATTATKLTGSAAATLSSKSGTAKQDSGSPGSASSKGDDSLALPDQDQDMGAGQQQDNKPLTKGQKKNLRKKKQKLAAATSTGGDADEIEDDNAPDNTPAEPQEQTQQPQQQAAAPQRENSPAAEDDEEDDAQGTASAADKKKKKKKKKKSGNAGASQAEESPFNAAAAQAEAPASAAEAESTKSTTALPTPVTLSPSPQWSASVSMSRKTSNMSQPAPSTGGNRRIQVNMQEDFESEPNASVDVTTHKDQPIIQPDALHGPFMKIGFGKQETKGEDKFCEHVGNKFTLPSVDAATAFSVFGVFDGHGGKQSATYASKNIVNVLGDYLSKVKLEAPEPVSLADAEEEVCKSWTVQDALVDRLPRALHAAFVSIDAECQRRFKVSGTTGTLAVLVGWELIVANVGDSCAYLDTGAEIIQISGNHRVSENNDDCERIKAAGGDIAQSDVDGKIAGPLRVWPGGLAMTRSLGDKEAAGLVIGDPEIRQVTIPPGGARLIIASDGLWDAIAPKTIISKVRSQVAGAAANLAMHEAIKRKGLADDITIQVIDLCVGPQDKMPAPLEAQPGYKSTGISRTNSSLPGSVLGVDSTQMWKPLDAPSWTWRNRLMDRRTESLHRHLHALEEQKTADDAAAAAEAARAQAVADEAAKTYRRPEPESETYKELANLRIDPNALEGLPQGEDLISPDLTIHEETYHEQYHGEDEVQQDDGEWTTVGGTTAATRTEAFIHNAAASRGRGRGEGGAVRGRGGRGERGRGAVRGGRGTARGGRGGAPHQEDHEQQQHHSQLEHRKSHSAAPETSEPGHEDHAVHGAGRGRGRGRGRGGYHQGRGGQQPHEEIPQFTPTPPATSAPEQQAAAPVQEVQHQEKPKFIVLDRSQIKNYPTGSRGAGPAGGRGRGRGRGPADHSHTQPLAKEQTEVNHDSSHTPRSTFPGVRGRGRGGRGYGRGGYSAVPDSHGAVADASAPSNASQTPAPAAAAAAPVLQFGDFGANFATSPQAAPAASSSTRGRGRGRG